jgi:hypothetical protein
LYSFCQTCKAPSFLRRGFKFPEGEVAVKSAVIARSNAAVFRGESRNSAAHACKTALMRSL